MNLELAKLKHSLQVLIAVMLLTFITCSPLMRGEYVNASDIAFHLLRFESLAQSIQSLANFPVRIYSMHMGGAGYGLGLFYPDLFLYPFAFLRNAGVDLLTVYKLYFVSIVALGSLSSYFAGRGITKRHVGGLFVMIAYSLFYYRFINLYFRGALSEVQAMIFVPIIVWGLYNFTEERFTKPWILLLGFTGIACSHTLSMAIAAVFAIAWSSIRLHKFILNPMSVFKGFVMLVLFLGLTCYSWLPMVEQMTSNEFNYQVPAYQHPSSLVYLDLFALLFPRSGAGLGFSGFVLLFAIPALSLWRLWKTRDTAPLKKCWAFYFAAFVLIALTCCRPFWFWMDAHFPANIQYPFRLHVVSLFLLSISAACLLPCFKSYKQAGLGVMLCLGLMNYQFLGNFKLEGFDAQLYIKKPSETFHIVRGEWLPSNVDADVLMAAPLAIAKRSDGLAMKGVYSSNGDFSLPVSDEMGVYEMPLIWYLGYEAVLKKNDGSEILLPLRANNRGLVELIVPPSASGGMLHVTYAGTQWQRVANRVSLASLLTCLLYLLLLSLRKCFCVGRTYRQSEDISK